MVKTENNVITKLSDEDVFNDDAMFEAITRWYYASEARRKSNVHTEICSKCHNSFDSCDKDAPISYGKGVYHLECYNELLSEEGDV